MEWTPAKLRYLLAFHALSQDSGTVRGIDIAVQLGISRASVSRMLAQFVEDGILQPAGRSGFALTELGRQDSDNYFGRFQSLYQLFHHELKLADYEARECAVTLITSLPEKITSDLHQKCDHYLQHIPPQA